ncbi:hypothetical protein FSP39_000760 [Pinctada imbricata]|uniref:ZAD domain-containing protein n=1 Tax=Pinctada imbricata TaxID=66713 RepID=A0AA88YMP7_PINIB|nr:hypothetical protein FSP39_000760 [Pinctada imbricata]
MAAPIAACRICLDEPSKKNRRVIFGETFHVLSQLTQVLDYVPSPCDGLSKYVCNLCFTKLNKLHKIDFDLVNKIDSLRKEKKELLCYLREKIPAREIVSPLKTPKRQEKRVITHSPTPRKTKKSLFSIRPRTEQHNELMDLASQPPKTHVMNVQAIIPGTQRKILPKPSQELGSVLHVSKSSMSEPSTCIAVKSFTPSKLKVVYKTKKSQRIRTKLVKDVQLSEIVKSLAIHNAPKRTARAIYNSSLKDAINVQIMKELKREISYLTSTTNLSLLRRSESRCLATFSFDKVNEEVKLFAPLFHKMVSTITKESCIGTAVTSCIALKSANTHMSAFQHVIGQVLDHGGATDEVW